MATATQLRTPSHPQLGHESDTPLATAPDAVELSIIMPCLNEAETLALCVRKAMAFLADHGIAGEVIVADNGSTDGSQQIANALGARIVHVPIRGYGAALSGGIAAAKGRFVAMGDADDSYDFGALMPFLEQLRDGADLVMGNRFRGGIAAGAMPMRPGSPSTCAIPSRSRSRASAGPQRSAASASGWSTCSRSATRRRSPARRRSRGARPALRSC